MSTMKPETAELARMHLGALRVELAGVVAERDAYRAEVLELRRSVGDAARMADGLEATLARLREIVGADRG